MSEWIFKELLWFFLSPVIDIPSPIPNTLATWCEEQTHWKRPWCWEELKAKGEGSNRGWNGWIASLTQWTWVWANSGRWFRKGKPGMLEPMGSQSLTWLSDWTTTPTLTTHTKSKNKKAKSLQDMERRGINNQSVYQTPKFPFSLFDGGTYLCHYCELYFIFQYLKSFLFS